MRVRYTATALIEAEEIISFIAKHNRSAAVAVRERIERTIALLAEVPEMAQLTDEPGVRKMPLRSYPYLIFYALEDDELVVLHVRHGARRLPWESDE
jgi:toxin ParE1/3/4